MNMSWIDWKALLAAFRSPDCKALAKAENGSWLSVDDVEADWEGGLGAFFWISAKALCAAFRSPDFRASSSALKFFFAAAKGLCDGVAW